MIRLGEWREVRTAEERAHWYVNWNDSPVLISKRWSITGARETIECIPAGSLRESETLAEDRGSTSGHARSSPEIGQQSLEEMLLEYVSPPCRYYSAGSLITAYSNRVEIRIRMDALFTCSEKYTYLPSLPSGNDKFWLCWGRASSSLCHSA